MRLKMALRSLMHPIQIPGLLPSWSSARRSCSYDGFLIKVSSHEGIWMKESKGSYELRGKTMGIIGYGNIGTQVSVLAESMGMKVLYYDIETKLPLGNAE